MTMSMAPARRPDELPPYTVLCVQLRPTGDAHEHVHAIETTDPDGGNTRWEPAEVIAAIRAGERFVLFDDGHGSEVLLAMTRCHACPTTVLAPDRPGIELPRC